MDNLKKWSRAVVLIGTVGVVASGCSWQFSTAPKTGSGEAVSEHEPVQNDKNPVQTDENSGQGNEQSGLKNQNSQQKDQKQENGHSQSNTKENPDDKKSTGKNDIDKPMLKETIKVTAEGTRVVTNPASLLVCADKHRNLPADYVPKHLVIPDIRFIYGPNADLPKMHIRKVAARPIEKLFNAADKAGVNLFGVSGYRSYEYQVTVFARNVEQYGSKEEANQVSAHPGQSEHQTGLTMDVTAPSVDYHLTQEFGQTKAGKWLAEHAWEYGFIIRYPKGKQDITGYEYEPWHIRYVGKKAAKVIAEKDLTLEEYLSK